MWYYPLPTAEGYVEEGYASWYGPECHGKPTASGEPFEMDAITAAHKTLPLGTHVKVTDTKTGQSIITRINDRGPFVAGRIIDLSRGSAKQLGSYRPGLARVRVEAVQVTTEEMVGTNSVWKVETVPNFRYGQFTVQIGSFKEQSNAQRLQGRMAKEYNNTQVALFNYRGSTFYRVQVGLYQDLLLARQEQEQLRRHGFPDAFVVAVEGK